MLKADKIRKSLEKIIKQGNNDQIAQIFVEIVNASEKEFTEDNLPTLAAFLQKDLLEAFVTKYPEHEKIIKRVMIAEIANNDINGV